MAVVITESEQDRPWALTRLGSRCLIAALASAVTILGILFVHPQSLTPFVYFFCLWNAYIICFNRDDIEDFAFAFLVNSSFIAIFVFIQVSVYPDTYGTTSPQSISWTDDSYFFALAADTLPPDLFVREHYFLYTNAFTSLIRAVTPLPIEHPLDVLFFQSGTAALLSTFSRRLMLQLSGNRKLADTVYVFALVCPFLMMNGGVLLIRDTFVAALLAYSLCCINSKRFLLAAVVIAWQFVLRPGTALVLLPAYIIIYFREIATFARTHPLIAALGATLFSILAVQFTPTAIEFMASQYGLPNIGFLGRELIADLTADPEANTLFLTIQEMPFGIKLFLNAAYIFLYPFLTLKTVLEADYFDLRNIAMSLVVPIYAYWLNAWFVAGALTSTRIINRQRAIVVAIAAILLLVGIYSLQSRHKTIIYPLYFIMIAIGFTNATPLARRCGYILSSAFLLIQIAAVLR